MNSEVTMSVRYNPWGKPIETDGIGNFDASYIGTLIDATTGLIYVGNGQYYDPETGRFLTRGVNPNSPNPYVPFNPIGVVLGPLALVSGSYARKKTKNAPKWLSILTLLLLSCVTASAVGMAFNSCWNIVFSGNSTPETPGGNGGVEGGMTSIPTPISTPSTPTPTPTYTDPCDNNQCTPTPSATPNYDDLFIITPEEVDRYGGGYAGMKAYLQNESEDLLLTRLGMGEGQQGNLLDIEYVMWTVKSRTVAGVASNLSGTTSIKAESLHQGFPPAYDYVAIGGLIEVAYPTSQSCSNLARRMGAPCPEHLNEFKEVYEIAKEIISSPTIPNEISGYDSFTGVNTGDFSRCNWGTYDEIINRSAERLAGASRFYDCWYEDNIKLGSPLP